MKNLSYYAAVLLFFSTAQLRADDITLVDGKTVYHNAKIINYDAASVTIKHSAGIARVMIPDLPPELRAQFKYDADAANKALADEKAQADARIAAQIVQQASHAGLNAQAQADQDWKRSLVRVTGTIFQITTDGVFIRLSVGDQLVFVKHANPGNCIDGDFVSVEAAPSGSYQYTDVNGSTRTIRAFDSAPPHIDSGK